MTKKLTTFLCFLSVVSSLSWLPKTSVNLPKTTTAPTATIKATTTAASRISSIESEIWWRVGETKIFDKSFFRSSQKQIRHKIWLVKRFFEETEEKKKNNKFGTILIGSDFRIYKPLCFRKPDDSGKWERIRERLRRPDLNGGRRDDEPRNDASATVRALII